MKTYNLPNFTSFFRHMHMLISTIAHTSLKSNSISPSDSIIPRKNSGDFQLFICFSFGLQIYVWIYLLV